MSSANTLAYLIGPCFTQEAVARHLDKTEEQVVALADEHRLLRIFTDTDEPLFPTFALDEKTFKPLPALRQVLVWLQAYSAEPTVWVWWLRTPNLDLGGHRPEHLLHDVKKLPELREAIIRDVAAKAN